jgi:hypothetical protein
MATLYVGHIQNGVPPHEPDMPDVREQPVGRFLGRVPPEGWVGSFGNKPYQRWHGRGTFRGDPDRQRQGTFGDHDLTDPASAERERLLRPHAA